jgi:hypothetical protein
MAGETEYPIDGWRTRNDVSMMARTPEEDT